MTFHSEFEGECKKKKKKKTNEGERAQKLYYS